MTNQHPITPPPELVEQWYDACILDGAITYDEYKFAAIAAQYGADQELEACCKYMQHEDFHGFATELLAARRPKPPSLKKQACDALDAYVYGNPDHGDKQDAYNTIRRALEQLDD